MWFVSSEMIMKISVFLLIFIDLTGYYIFEKENNKKGNFIKKMIVFYILAWLILVWVEFSTRHLNQVIHIVVVVVFASLSLLVISFIRPKTNNREKLPSKEITNKTYFITRITFSVFICLLSIIGWGTERLKDISFTGGYNITISLDSAYTKHEIAKLLENSFDYDMLNEIGRASCRERV